MHVPQSDLHSSPTNGALRLVSAGAWSAPRGRDFPPHQHTCWEVVYYRDGHIRCPLGDEAFAGRPGAVLATPPGVVHAEVAVTGYANYWVQIDAPTDTPWPRACCDDADQAIGSVCRRLVRETARTDADSPRLIALLLAELDLLLRRAARELDEPSDAESVVRRAEGLMAARAGGPLTVKQVAREVGVSPSTLRAHFVALRGAPPREHLQSVRVRNALALLRTSSLTLESVAHLCGFDSASHLSRHVKRVTGVAPGALRRSERAPIAPGSASR
jgi:AraC-like DNA-binding protein